MNNDIYTMEQWKADGEFKAVPGQEIEEQIYDEMLNAASSLRLPREAFRSALENHKILVHAGFMRMKLTSAIDEDPIYYAFGMNDYGTTGKKYYYLGLFYPEKVLDGTYYYFDCMNAFANDGLFPADEFKDDKEAVMMGADYEATVYKYEFNKGVKVRSTILYDPIY